MDETKLMEFVGKAVTDVGTLLGGAMVVLGDRLGLYRAMAGAGSAHARPSWPSAPAPPSATSGSGSSAQAADRVRDLRRRRSLLAARRARHRRSPTRRARRASSAPSRPPSPACTPPTASPRPSAPAAGVGLGRAPPRPLRGLRALLPARLRGQPGVDLAAGPRRRRRPSSRRPARVADVGCGHGASTVLMAEAFPDVDVRRLRRPRAVDPARPASAPPTPASPTTRTSRWRTAQDFSGRVRPRLLLRLPARHGRSRRARCRHVREALAPGGTLLLVEPMAGDTLEDNLNPVGAAYYGFSTLLCTPNSLSQDVGAALGAQAGEARLREIAHRRRLHLGPPGRRDPVQHGPRADPVTP